MEKFNKGGDIFQCKLNIEDGTEFIIPMREDGLTVRKYGMKKHLGTSIHNERMNKE